MQSLSFKSLVVMNCLHSPLSSVLIPLSYLISPISYLLSPISYLFSSQRYSLQSLSFKSLMNCLLSPLTSHLSPLSPFLFPFSSFPSLQVGFPLSSHLVFSYFKSLVRLEMKVDSTLRIQDYTRFHLEDHPSNTEY